MLSQKYKAQMQPAGWRLPVRPGAGRVAGVGAQPWHLEPIRVLALSQSCRGAAGKSQAWLRCFYHHPLPPSPPKAGDHMGFLSLWPHRVTKAPVLPSFSFALTNRWKSNPPFKHKLMQSVPAWAIRKAQMCNLESCIQIQQDLLGAERNHQSRGRWGRRQLGGNTRQTHPLQYPAQPRHSALSAAVENIHSY